MKAASIKKWVDNFKKTPESNLDKLEEEDGGRMKKVMYRVLAFSQFILNGQSPNTLLDSVASVHVFNIKERFLNFKRALKGQGLLYGSNVILIKRLRQSLLLLKVKSRIKLPTLTDLAYILYFSLNLVSLGCLQKRGFDWSYRSSEILKNNQIIRYTQFHGNNYKIDDKKTDGIVVAILAIDPATPRNSRPYQGPNFAATSDAWYRRMSHIGSLGLHMLGKKCLGARWWGKNMSQGTHFAVSKISQQVSHRPPSNKSIELFHIVYIDWLDLKDG